MATRKIPQIFRLGFCTGTKSYPAQCEQTWHETAQTVHTGFSRAIFKIAACSFIYFRNDSVHTTVETAQTAIRDKTSTTAIRDQTEAVRSSAAPAQKSRRNKRLICEQKAYIRLCAGTKLIRFSVNISSNAEINIRWNVYFRIYIAQSEMRVPMYRKMYQNSGFILVACKRVTSA